MERFRNISNKVLAILAVALILCMTCVTAFAATITPFDGSVPGEYTVVAEQGNTYEWNIVEGYTYTIDNFVGPLGKVQGLAVSYDDGATWTGLTHSSYPYAYTATGNGKMHMNGGYNWDYTAVVSVTAPNPLAEILGDVKDLGGSMWSLGTSLVGWMTTPANAIVLIGVGLFVLVAVVGGIRRLIVG